LENVVANYTDPTSRPVDPDVEQPDPRLGEAVSDPRLGEAVSDTRLGEAGPRHTFADSELEYPRTERAGVAYDQPDSFESEEGSTVEAAKSEAANVKDAAAGAATGVKEVAKSEASYVAEEAKSQTRNLMDQTRSELRGQARNQQSNIALKLNGWASELGSMASKSDESGPMTDLAGEASRRLGEFSYWLDSHEPADLLDEVRRFARRRPATFLALAAAAGVVAGRLTRGAVAANTSVDSDTDVIPARAYGSDVGDRRGHDGELQGRSYGARAYESGYDPRYGERYGETSYQGGGMPDPGQYSAGPAAPGEYPATGPTHPDVTPATDEPYYPPPAEGEVRR
jgi:vacuolar-type H+-ATPase subunit H